MNSTQYLLAGSGMARHINHLKLYVSALTHSSLCRLCDKVLVFVNQSQSCLHRFSPLDSQLTVGDTHNHIGDTYNHICQLKVWRMKFGGTGV